MSTACKRPIPMSGFARVAALQAKFANKGWRWQETTFENGEVMIQFSPSANPHAFSIGNGSESREQEYGWGRFERLTAWENSYAFLILESGNPKCIERLRQYKAEWGIA